jgi:hypothetical protein
MKNHMIGTAGLAVEQHYRGFHLALVGVTHEAMQAHAPTIPRVRAIHQSDAYLLQSNALSAIANVFDIALSDVIEHAVHSAHPGADDALRAQIADEIAGNRSAALATLSMAMQKDCMVAVKRLRDFNLRVDLSVQGGSRSYQSAVISARIAEQAKPVRFIQTDTLGRQWKPSTFASTTVKGVLQGAYADAFVRAAAAQGVSTLTVQYDDPEHDGHGQRISLTDDTYPAYLSLRDSVFHPNSSATLALLESSDVQP